MNSTELDMMGGDWTSGTERDWARPDGTQCDRVRRVITRRRGTGQGGIRRNGTGLDRIERGWERTVQDGMREAAG